MNSVTSVIRPQVPYWGPVAGGIFEGKLIEIQGTVPYGADVFEINLVTGSDPASDRPLHLSVRFHDRTVVRNTLQHNAWGIEERDGPFPFASGRDFKLLILCEQNAFRISVDGSHAWVFAHRMSMQRVNMVFIGGSVKINQIEFLNRSSQFQIGTCMPPMPIGIVPNPYPVPGSIYPHQIGTCMPPQPVGIPDPYPVTGAIYPATGPIGGCIIPGTVITTGLNPGICTPAVPPIQIGTCMPPENYFPSSGISSNLSPVYNPTIPYAYPIYGGLKPGMMVYISGRPSVSAYRFTINFQCGTSPYPPPDIGFHFDARFFNNTVVRNTRQNDTWGSEDVQAPFFPFQHGVNFDLIIRVESDKYMVALNGQHFTEFSHRMWPLSRLDTLYIEHDIVVSSIRFA